MYEQFWEENRKYNEEHKPREMAHIVIRDNPTFNKNVFLQSINDIPNMSDAQLRNFIDHHFDNLLNAVFTGNQTDQHITCFTNVRFLDALIDVLNTQKFYENDIIIKLNNICYDYISLPTKDPEVVNRMISISSLINRVNMPRLLGLGLSTTLATTILIARYSNFNIDICVRRVNFIIITQPKVIMTNEMITQIFRIIYSGTDIWPRIFQYFMLDVLPEYDGDNWVTEDMEEINSEINLVILDILNTQPMITIRAALLNYAEAYPIINRGKPYRFSMQTLSDDYSNIKNMVMHLKYNEGIIVP